MTTTAKISVQGDYRASVRQTSGGVQVGEVQTVERGKDLTLTVEHGRTTAIEITEEVAAPKEPVPDDPTHKEAKAKDR